MVNSRKLGPVEKYYFELNTSFSVKIRNIKRVKYRSSLWPEESSFDLWTKRMGSVSMSIVDRLDLRRLSGVPRTLSYPRES